jgi:hypothetical protein
MIFFDPKNPNKYDRLKKELIPYTLNDSYGKNFVRKKFGKGDGGYVLAYNEEYFDNKSFSFLSYGIGGDPSGVSFEQSLDKIGIKDPSIHMYDGSIDDLPIEINNSSFFKEYLTQYNFKKHVTNLITKSNSDRFILKMDIEGCEYDWLTEENLEILYDTFDQFTLEVHGLIEEVPDGWIIDQPTQDAKNNLQKKVDFFKRLNEHFYLFHIHGNNHSPRFVDLPDSLELTYVNKKISKKLGINNNPCPDDVDEANYEGREDYELDWWIYRLAFLKEIS